MGADSAFPPRFQESLQLRGKLKSIGNYYRTTEISALAAPPQKKMEFESIADSPPIPFPPSVKLVRTGVSFLADSEAVAIVKDVTRLIWNNWKNIVSFYSGKMNHVLHIAIPDDMACKYASKVREWEGTVYELEINNLLVQVQNNPKTGFIIVLDNPDRIHKFRPDEGAYYEDEEELEKVTQHSMLGGIVHRMHLMTRKRALLIIGREFIFLQKDVFRDLVKRQADKIVEFFGDESAEQDPHYRIDLWNTKEGEEIAERIKKIGFHDWFCIYHEFPEYNILLKKTAQEYYISVNIDPEDRETLREEVKFKRRLVERD